MKKTIYSKKYGVGPVRFTHRSNNVIHASSKGEDAIRYLSLHDNAYLRYFRGHEARVTALDLSPLDDTFISGAKNDSVRLWDLRSPNCHGVLAVNGIPLVAFDPQGLVFAVVLDNRLIRLFDMKNYERGPFACFEIIDSQRSNLEWCSLSFSPDGKEILIGTKGAVHYLVDSFEGHVRAVYSGHQNTGQLCLLPSMTPDGKYVLGGSQDGKIHIWSRENAKSIAVLEGHTSYPSLVKFNPRLAMMASACSNLALWQP